MKKSGVERPTKQAQIKYKYIYIYTQIHSKYRINVKTSSTAKAALRLAEKFKGSVSKDFLGWTKHKTEEMWKHMLAWSERQLNGQTCQVSHLFLSECWFEQSAMDGSYIHQEGTSSELSTELLVPLLSEPESCSSSPGSAGMLKHFLHRRCSGATCVMR